MFKRIWFTIPWTASIRFSVTRLDFLEQVCTSLLVYTYKISFKELCYCQNPVSGMFAVGLCFPLKGEQSAKYFTQDSSTLWYGGSQLGGHNVQPEKQDDQPSKYA